MTQVVMHKKIISYYVVSGGKHQQTYVFSLAEHMSMFICIVSLTLHESYYNHL